jgi:hypothetical protein
MNIGARKPSAGRASSGTCRRIVERCSMANRELRPLGLGELLDRAVTLCARNAGLMLAAIAVPYVLLALLQWALFGDRYAPSTYASGRSEWNALGIDTIVGVTVFLFARGAAARVAHERYAERSIAPAAAFRTGFRRFGPLLGLTLIATIGGAAVAFVLSVVFTLVTGFLGVFGAAGTIVRVVVGLPVFLPALAWYVFAYDLATVRVALGASPSIALFAALGATAIRRPWRSLLAAVIAALIPVAVPVMIEYAAEALPFAPLRVTLELGVVNIASIIGEALSVAFLVAYDVDIAVRHEGYDLALGLEEPSRA